MLQSIVCDIIFSCYYTWMTCATFLYTHYLTPTRNVAPRGLGAPTGIMRQLRVWRWRSARAHASAHCRERLRVLETARSWKSVAYAPTDLRNNG